MMHLPLLLSSDTVLQKRKSWPNLHWIGEDARKVYQISRHLVGEVDLQSGSSSRISQLNSVIKVAAAVNYTYDATYVYGITTSGDLFFWNQKSKTLCQARGIPDLVTHITPSADRDSVDGPVQSMLDSLKNLRTPNLGAAENTQSNQGCSVPSHHKPKIFASDDCSKVVVVLGASQVHLWERDLAQSKDGRSSLNISGHWSVVMCPTDVPLPSLQSRETQISSCFLAEGSLGNKCHITFSFVGASCLVTTTLTLQWGSSGNAMAAGRVLSAYWNSISISHQAVGMRESEMLQKRGTLVSRYAHGQSLISIAVNSCQCSKLLYLHPYCNTAVVINIYDGVYQDLPNANNSRSHWVSDLSWSRDDTYVVGCLRSGAIFMATRLGPPVKISCTGKNLELQPATILPLHPLHDLLSKEVNNEEASLSSENLAASRPSFSVSCHPLRDQFLLSSGLRVSVLALPENGRRDAEVVDQLLMAAKHALYLLQNSSVTHDYAYIHCSAWRLAQSVLDLSKNLSKSAIAERCKINLWDKNPVSEDCNTRTDNHSDDGEKLIEQVMRPLLAAWTLISSHRGPQTNDWKAKAMHVAKQLVKLVSILMQTSLNDDYSEHQAMLLQMLHIFHRFVKVLTVWPKSLHMLKPTQWLTHQIIHTFLRCEKHAGENSMVDTLLILTQALCSVEGTLTQVYKLRPVLQTPSQLMYSISGDAPGIEVTNVTAISSTARGGRCEGLPAVCLRMKKPWVCLYLNSKKVYLRLGEKKFEQRVYQKLLAVMNVVQSRLQQLGLGSGKKMVRLDKCDRLYLNGVHLAAVKEWKTEIIRSLPHKRDRRKIGRYLHSVLYTYLLHKDFIGISDFLSWLYNLLKANMCTKEKSSLPNKASTPKLKKDSRSPPLEVYLDVSHITQEAAEVSNASRQTANWISNESFAAKDNRDKTSQECNRSIEELQSISHLISMARLVIGSLGRIMAQVILQRDVYIPSPHSPHAIPCLWDHSSKLKDRGIAPCCPSLLNDAIHAAHWSSETAAQALAIAGYWYDITALSQGLGDARIALLSSLIAEKVDENRVTMSSSLHPSAIIKDLVLQSGPMEDLKASVFHSHRELMQVASMYCLDILPNILEECLGNMQKVMLYFEVFVPSDVYLPAPPVFCPQVTSSSNDVPKSSNDINRYDERILRKELAGWVRLFCCVVSAAGIAQPLLQISHTSLQEPRKVSHEYNEELDILAETLGPLQSDWTPRGPEWSGITELWQKFLSRLWALHARDKLSLCLRKFTVDTSSFYQRKVSQGTHAVEILSWVQELHKVTDVDHWKDELISTALTAASNAPPNPVVAQLLANIIPEPANLPSLLRDKAARLFNQWKNTDVVVTEVREESHEMKGKSGRHKSLIETYAKLYSIYDQRCAKEVAKGNSHKDGKDCTPSYNEDNSDISSDILTAPGTIGEEMRRFRFLLASMTFARDAEMFPQHFAQIPQLVQFSDAVKKREFQGLRIRSQILQAEHNSNAECMEQNVSDYTNHNISNVTPGLASPGKKGFFRNLAHSKINEGGVKTVFHETFLGSRSTNRSHSLSPFHKTHNRRNLSSHRTKETGPPSSHLKPEHSARRRLQYSTLRLRSLERSRSHSSSARERGASSSDRRKRRSRSTGSAREKSKSRLLDLNDSMTPGVNQKPPLKHILHLSKYHDSVKNEAFQEMINLVHWLMSSERRLCPPSNMRVDEHSTIKKVELCLEDIVLALSWEYLFPCKFHRTKKAVVPFEHSKKSRTEIKEAEVSEDKDLKAKHKQNVKRTVSSHDAVTAEVKVKDSEQGYSSTNAPDGTNMRTDGKMRENDINTMSTNTSQTSLCIPEKEERIGNQITTNSRHDTERRGSDSTHEDNHDFKTATVTPHVGQGNELSSSPSSHSSSYNHREVPDITTEDQQDGKAVESMISQNNHNSDPKLEDSCKATESKKTEVILSNGVNKDTSHNTEKVTSAFKMSVQNAVREELRSFFEGHPLGLHALAGPSHQVTENAQVNNSPENGTFQSTSIITQQESEKKSEETVNGWKIRGKRLDKDRITHQQNDLESDTQSDSTNAQESLKARNGSSHNPKALIIEVKEAEKLAVRHRPLPNDHKKKASLTPVEKPSQIQDLEFGASLKLLHMPPELNQESKKLSIADLCDDDDVSLDSQSVSRAVDDTLDDVTLPDSLHVSDLDENYRDLQSRNVVQEDIMKGNRLRPSRKNVTGEGVSKLNRTVTLKKTINQKSKQSVRWDQKELILKSLPIQTKTAPANVAHNLSEQSTSGQFEPQSSTERNAGMKKTLKLLTFPKQLPQNVETNDDYPPLLLKQLPINKTIETKSKNKVLFAVPNKGCSDHLSDKQNSKQFTHSAKEVKLKNMALLTIPTSSYTQVSRCRGPDSIRFLDPKQVFNYYAANMIKRKQHRFKTLRIKEPPENENINEIYGKKVYSSGQTVDIKEMPKSDAQENIDKGFLDSVKEYAAKYEAGAFKDVLAKGSDGTVKSKFQFEATRKMDRVYQGQSRHSQSSKGIQTLPQAVSDFQNCGTYESKDSGRPVRDRSRVVEKMDKLYQSQPTQITRETQTLSQELNDIEKKTSSDHKAVGVQAVPIMEERESECGLTSLHFDLRAPDSQSPEKLAETRVVKIRDSWTETDILGPRLHLPHEIHEAQTQTPVRLTKDTSVTAYIAPSYQPQSQLSQDLPVTQPQEDLPSQPLRDTDTNGDVTYTVNSPEEIVLQEVEGIEKEPNKTKCDLDPETLPSSSAAMKTERHAGPIEVRNTETENNSVVKRVEGFDMLQTVESSLGTDIYENDFNQYEGLRSQYMTRDMEDDVLQNDVIEMPTELAEDKADELHTTTADLREIFGSDEITMNELTEAFYHGRITFEDLCKMSSNVQIAEEEQNLEERNDGGNIERLEQQTVEAAQSLRETRDMMSKLNHLLRTSERFETERMNAHKSTASDGGFHYSLPTMKNKSWQQALSEFKNNSNADILLQFVEDANPEDITNEMIDEITSCVEAKVSKHSARLPLYSREISSPHSKRVNRRGISSYEDVKTDQKLPWMETDRILRQTVEDRIGSQLASDYRVEMSSIGNTCRTEDHLNDPRAMPELHLDLSGLRSESSNSLPFMSYQSSERQLSSSLDLDEKRQSRRAEVRTWMKMRRKKRAEQAVPQNTISKKTYRDLLDSKSRAESALESTSTIRAENQGLSGKQLRRSSQEREEKRNLLREDHQRKREEDVLKLLTDHEEDLMTHRNVLVKKQVKDSPQVINSNGSQQRQRLLSAKSEAKLATPSQKRIQAKQKPNRNILQPTFAKPFKPRLRTKKKSEVKTCFSGNVSTSNREMHSTSISDDLSSLSMSPFSSKVISDRDRTYVIEKMEKDQVQVKLDSLVKCLRATERDQSLSVNKSHESTCSSNQMRNNHGKKCEKIEQRPFGVGKVISVNGKHKERSKPETSHQMSSTFTVPLDRISEVDSNVSADGDSEGKESLPRRPNGHEDTSSESSWSVPDDVKRLLHG